MEVDGVRAAPLAAVRQRAVDRRDDVAALPSARMVGSSASESVHTPGSACSASP